MEKIKEDLKTDIDKDISILKNLNEYISTSDFLENLPEGVFISLNKSTKRILIRVPDDYPLLVETLRVLRKESGNEMKIDNNWYACGVMLFSWVTPELQVWFECNPDEVPIELLPSGKCEVKEQLLEPERTYSIVCDI